MTRRPLPPLCAIRSASRSTASHRRSNRRSQFVKNYDAIMTGAITDAVVNQKLDELFVNWKGIMFGDGEVWIDGICSDNSCKNVDIKVATIQSTADLKAAAAASGQLRCGWIKNPTPGNLFSSTRTRPGRSPRRVRRKAPMRPGSITSLRAMPNSSSTRAAAPAMATVAAVFRSRPAPGTSASPR